MKSIFTILLITLSIWCFSQKNIIIPDYHKFNKEIHDVNYKNLKQLNPELSKYDVKFYGIDLTVLNTTAYIIGNSSIKAQVIEPIDNFVCQLVNELIVDSVKYDSSIVSYTHLNHELNVILPNTVNTGEFVYVTVYYHGNTSTIAGYSGIDNATSPSWGKKATWTLSESYHAKEWFACKEDVTDKADSAYVFVTTANTCKAGANGILTGVETVAGNKLKFKWKTYYPIDYYLISLSVSEYSEYNIYAHPANYSDSILIQNYIYNNSATLPYFKTSIDQTVDCIELFSDKFGLYPFANEKYGHCMAPISGGMEHQTMTTLGYFNFQLVSHELAHQWFGDYITCRTWQDLWINEGFASYSEYVAEQYINSQTSADTWINNCHSQVLSQPDGSVFIPFADVMDESRLFDYRLTYLKGAAIIHTIRYIINNDSLFFNFITDYTNHFANSVASGDDFRDYLSLKTGIDFTNYFNEWYYGEGHPVYNVVWSQLSDTVTLKITQNTSTSITTFFSNPFDVKFSYSGGDTIIRYTPFSNIDIVKFIIPHQISGIAIDPNNWIVDEAGSVIVGTEKFENRTIDVYPNPTSESLNISNLNNSLVQIFDINGKLLFQKNENFGKLNVKVKHFNSGIYLLKVIDDEQILNYKFIKE